MREVIDGVEFFSDFDSANLGSVVSTGEEDGFKTFELRTLPDCHGTPQETQNRTWFYFGISRVTPKLKLQLTVRDLNRQGKLFSQGHEPVVRVQHGDREPSKWTRACENLTYDNDDDFSIEWEYTCGPLVDEDTRIFFAFCYPFSYEEIQRRLETYDESFGFNWTLPDSDAAEADGGDAGPAVPPSIYYHRELLVRSHDGLRVDLVTVTSPENMMSEEEPRLANLFPDEECSRARRFEKKKVFFMSSRVHPGEVPATHVFNGFLDFILQPDDPRAQLLRQTYVFKLIPCLNPDGVKRGHYRMDAAGVNLNRFYDRPSLEHHPSIYAARAVCLHHHSRKNLEFYVDLHAHAGKRGCFIFGNALEIARQERNVSYARLVALNTPHFDFDNCSFSERGMFSKDRNSLSKEGSGRVGIFLATNITHVYTLECNYNTGRSVNQIPVITADDPRAERTPPLSSVPPPYTEEIWEDVGKAVAIAALDLLDRNPWSRLPASEYGGLGGLRKHTAAMIKSSRQKSGNSPGALPRRVAVALRNSKALEVCRAAREEALARKSAEQAVLAPPPRAKPVANSRAVRARVSSGSVLPAASRSPRRSTQDSHRQAAKSTRNSTAKATELGEASKKAPASKTGGSRGMYNPKAIAAAAGVNSTSPDQEKPQESDSKPKRLSRPLSTTTLEAVDMVPEPVTSPVTLHPDGTVTHEVVSMLRPRTSSVAMERKQLRLKASSTSSGLCIQPLASLTTRTPLSLDDALRTTRPSGIPRSLGKPIRKSITTNY